MDLGGVQWSFNYSDTTLTPGNTVIYRIRADNGNLQPAPYSSAPTAVTTTMTDTDGDGILDFTDPDDDNDGVLDADESTLLTDPLKADSDHAASSTAWIVTRCQTSTCSPVVEA